jgi:hypothetical protein
MTLSTGGATYAMQRPAAAGNPLAGEPPANPLAGAAGNAPKSASNYSVLASNDSGKTLIAQRPDLKTAQDALQCAMSDMATRLDSKPTLVKAVTDSKNNSSGMASFTGTYKGAPAKGNIFCSIGPNGATITVIFAINTAPQSEIAALENGMPGNPTFKTIQFPNNLGSVQVADGWKIVNLGPNGHCVIAGPEGQALDLADLLHAVPPNSQQGQTIQRQIAQLKASGRPIPNHLMIAPLSDPADAIKAFFPQLSEISQGSGGPPLTLVQINSSVDAKAFGARDKSAYIDYTSTRGTGDSAQHLHTFGQFETGLVANGLPQWNMSFTTVQAPEAIFARDKALMLKMARSLNINQQVVAANMKQKLDQQKDWFNNFENQQKQQQAVNESQIQDTENNELIQERSNTNEDEIIRDYRDVEDTTTGEKTSVDLGNVDDVVNNLNQADPGRYKEVPLRDEVYPLPGNDGN